MALSHWLLRCFPGLSLLALFIFLEFTLGHIQQLYWQLIRPSSKHPITYNHTLLWILVCYDLMLHFASFNFPIRLFWAAWRATTSIEEAHREDDDDDSTKVGTPVEDDNIKSLDLNYIEPTDGIQVTMAIIIPAYKEDISTMEDTLSVLASHPMAREGYHVFLAMEERDPNAHQMAQTLVKSFEQQLLRIQYTIHPAGIPGEAPGKSSNVSWAAKEVERYYTGSPACRNVLVTTMDSDTHLLPQYFQHVRDAHHRNRRFGFLTDMTLYMPPIIFDRNALSVPAMVRVADLMWSGAGLSCFLPTSSPSSIGIPTAVYTIPLALVHLVDGWDTGPDAIGEDMHMMLKCYFATHGRLRIESIPSPASQCNIATDVKGIRGWFAGHNARYNQGLRHMWGCLDTGFALTNWLKMGARSSPQSNSNTAPSQAAEKTVTRRPRKLSHTELSLKLSQYALHGCEARRWTWRNVSLASRLFEAHFLPAHLVTMIIATSVFTSSATITEDLKWFRLCLSITEYMRLASFLIMLSYFFICYERYHRVGLEAREREMRKAGLYEQLAGQFSHRRSKWSPFNWIDYLIFPIAGTIFGSVCLFQAAFSHLYTNELVYLVSAKPVRALLAAATTVPSNTINEKQSHSQQVPLMSEKQV